MLSGKAMEQLSEALRSAFPCFSDLEQVVAFKLDTSLREIVAPAGLRQVAFELIIWAESQGRLAELIRSAHAYRPGNALLKKCHDDFFAVAPGPDEMPHASK